MDHAERFGRVVENLGAGRDDHVDEPFFDQVSNDPAHPGGDDRPGDPQPDGDLFLAEDLLPDGKGLAERLTLETGQEHLIEDSRRGLARFNPEGDGRMLKEGGSHQLMVDPGPFAQADPLAVNEIGRPADIFRELDAAVEEDHFVVGRFKDIEQFTAGVIGVKILAGKDVDEGVLLVGKSMDRDVGLGDQDDAGDPPIFGHFADVFKNVRRHDLGHLDLSGKVVEGAADQVHVGQFLFGTTVTIEHQMRAKTVFNLIRRFHSINCMTYRIFVKRNFGPPYRTNEHCHGSVRRSALRVPPDALRPR